MPIPMIEQCHTQLLSSGSVFNLCGVRNNNGETYPAENTDLVETVIGGKDQCQVSHNNQVHVCAHQEVRDSDRGVQDGGYEERGVRDGDERVYGQSEDNHRKGGGEGGEV